LGCLPDKLDELFISLAGLICPLLHPERVKNVIPIANNKIIMIIFSVFIVLVLVQKILLFIFVWFSFSFVPLLFFPIHLAIILLNSLYPSVGLGKALNKYLIEIQSIVGCC
jgi:hypothetical protein